MNVQEFVSRLVEDEKRVIKKDEKERRRKELKPGQKMITAVRNWLLLLLLLFFERFRLLKLEWCRGEVFQEVCEAKSVEV